MAAFATTCWKLQSRTVQDLLVAPLASFRGRDRDCAVYTALSRAVSSDRVQLLGGLRSTDPNDYVDAEDHPLRVYDVQCDADSAAALARLGL